jgi:predicted Co/Zn/Cd cation transporter (cation efflux family)
MLDPYHLKLARRARVQLISAVVFAALTILALLVPAWIEEVSGLSPDGGGGELELLLAVPFGLVSVFLGALAWRTRRRLRATDAGAV